MLLDKWQNRFLGLAEEISCWSKDPSKKVGAIIVRDRRILSTGYNGFPSLIEDDFSDIEKKNHFMIHAEANAILNAAKAGVSISGASIYVSGLCPCEDCAKLIIQSGIAEVIYDYNPHHMSKWFESCRLGRLMFEKAGVKYTHTMPSIIMLTGKKGSGKSTIAGLMMQYYRDHHIDAEVVSFASTLKQVLACTLGIDLDTLNTLKNTDVKVAGDKTMRELLQYFGTDAMQTAFGKDVWKSMTLDYIKRSDKQVIIIDDWRFPHETISGALKVRIKGGDTTDTHISENALDQQPVDIELDNSKRDLSYRHVEQIVNYV